MFMMRLPLRTKSGGKAPWGRGWGVPTRYLKMMWLWWPRRADPFEGGGGVWGGIMQLEDRGHKWPHSRCRIGFTQANKHNNMRWICMHHRCSCGWLPSFSLWSLSCTWSCGTGSGQLRCLGGVGKRGGGLQQRSSNVPVGTSRCAQWFEVLEMNC